MIGLISGRQKRRSAVPSTSVHVAARAMPSLQAIDALLSQAEANHRTGRTPAALEELREAHRLAPSATLAPFELGNLLLAALQSSSSPLSPSHAEQAKRRRRPSVPLFYRRKS